MREIEQAQRETLTKRLVSKKYHGEYAKEMRAAGVDDKATTAWLCEGKLRPPTVSIIMAAQDGVTSTRDHLGRFPGGPPSRLCRLCGEHVETLGHLLSKCPIYENREYRRRHDAVLHILVKAVGGKLGLKVPNSLKEKEGGVRCGVMGTRETLMLIDLCIPTSRYLKERRPDLLVRLQKEKRIVIMEVAVAWEPIVSEREKEKRAKYDDLAADLAKQWPGYKIVIVPVVIGDLGLIRNLRKFLARAKILNTQEIAKFAAEAQREVLCWNVKLLKRTLVSE